MIQVHTRDGIFGPGGYGGGVFDGSGMGFGGLGKNVSEQMGIGLGLTSYAPGSRTIRQGSTGTDVQFAQKKFGVNADGIFGAGTKAAAIKYQSANHLTADGVIGPATWAVLLEESAGAPPAVAVVGGSTPIIPGVEDDRILELQFALNTSLSARRLAMVQENGILDAATCAGVKAIVAEVKSGRYDVSVDGGLDKILASIGASMESACKGMTTVAPAPVVTTPPGAMAVCKFNYGTKAPEVELLQRELNVALDAEGYITIPVTGVYDAATCGAIFELGGSFAPEPQEGISSCIDWTVPFECPDKVLPKKKTDATTGKSSAAMAWMLGGLAAAAAAGIYVSMKHR